MTTRKKLWTGIASLALVFVLAGTAVGITFAALSGKVSSGFTINYTARNISATVTGSYGYSTGNLTQMTSNGDDKILFTGSETSGNEAKKSFDPLGNIDLSATNNSVTFKYKFLNFNEKDLPISFSLDGDMENLDIDYTIKTFDGEKTTFSQGTASDLPLSINDISVAYSGFSSYEELEELYGDEYSPSISESEEFQLNIYKILFSEGAEKAMQAFDDHYVSEGGEIGDITYVFTIAMGFYDIFAMNAYRIFLETKSIEKALEFIDNLDLETIWHLKYIDELYNYEGSTLTFTISADHAIKQLKVDTLALIVFDYMLQGDYKAAYQPSLDILDILHSVYLEEEANESTNKLDWEDYAYIQNVLIINVYDTFINSGYDSAIAQLDELYQKNSWYFTTFFYQQEDYHEEYYNEIKDELSTLNEKGDEGISEAQEEVDYLISQYEWLSDTLQDYKEIIGTVLCSSLIDSIIYNDLVPYTEITVTISLKNNTTNAHLNSGSFEFVLG